MGRGGMESVEAQSLEARRPWSLSNDQVSLRRATAAITCSRVASPG